METRAFANRCIVWTVKPLREMERERQLEAHPCAQGANRRAALAVAPKLGPKRRCLLRPRPSFLELELDFRLHPARKSLECKT